MYTYEEKNSISTFYLDNCGYYYYNIRNCIKKRNVKKITLTIGNITMEASTKSGGTSTAIAKPSPLEPSKTTENPPITIPTKHPCKYVH